MSRQADSQQLKVALQELKLSRELCNQLTSEHEENEKILLEALENNTKLKNGFDQCGAEYENTLKRNSILERELCDAHKQIAQMEEESRFSGAQETQSLFNELLSANSVVKQVSVASNNVAGSVIDLTHDNTVPPLNSVCNKKTSKYRLECGVRQGGVTSPDLFNLYVNGLIEELRGTKVGCHVGNVCVSNLSYADDMVLLSPSITGLRKLLSVCEHYANAHGLKYNVSKTKMMVFPAGGGPDMVPEVYLNGTVISVVKQFKYLGHVLTERLQDDEDIERERRALAVRGNMLARRFAKCSRDVKTTLFKAYCLGMYTCQLWVTFTHKAFRRIRVQYNDTYRAFMNLPRCCSASGMFVEGGVPDFFAVIRTRIATFWSRLRSSKNKILTAISDDIRSPIYKRWISVHMENNKK
ncbi:uncharacterized protein LOC126965003 [Leptidea sinapis]|uniref:uncharacterized protein LOC126965003 n=1 Tax=Leptidea sinapis TaxID=189913 RepID=UPI0021C4A05B|nr:uncharacterized protein LOC126965003 [Leptidea sinapis]